MSTTTTITPEEIQALDLDLLTVPKIKCICIAALTLFTWDLKTLVLTFPHENAKWTFAKVLFFVNRYFALGTVILITFLTFDVTPTWAICELRHLHPLTSLMEMLGSANTIFAVIVANIEMILQLRLYALYAYDKRIVLPVSALFVAVFSGMMVMAVIIYQYENNHKAEIFGACAILGVPMMGLDLVLVLLAGYKSLQHYFQVPDKTWSGARLMRTFARDSIIYFLCTLLGRFGPGEYYQLGAITVTVVPPISANRLLINMYDSAHAEQERDTRVHHDDIELASISMEETPENPVNSCFTPVFAASRGERQSPTPLFGKFLHLIPSSEARKLVHVVFIGIATDAASPRLPLATPYYIFQSIFPRTFAYKTHSHKRSTSFRNHLNFVHDVQQQQYSIGVPQKAPGFDTGCP
ncbi:uncharacterized protein BJ212DRAFT_1555326 [Suillus subaureus]|uniref:DUF6533 domain-containing protein n=1 Tax=Suillus subaureus TaxID=48587 RepID=A0A9P7JFE0_9AGAM|nr:uncharacterized protein BJ212DRAFT_1555326 [Suillus subaureus]KAG1819786.1 hypothetical protein BJ212DRAFT_1555326 [Suillus subaureus]